MRGKKNSSYASVAPRNGTKASDYAYRGKLEDLETSRDDERLARILTQAVVDAETGDDYLRHTHRAQESMAFYEGDQWLDAELKPSWAPEWRYRATRNICFGIIETMSGTLTDIRPTPIFTADYEDASYDEAAQYNQLRRSGAPLPRKYDVLTSETPRYTDRDIARHLNNFFQAELDYREEENLMMDLTFDFGIAGRGVRRLWWDRNDGRVGVTQYDSLDCIHDPYCNSRNWRRKAKYTILCKEMDAIDVQRKYRVSKDRMAKMLDSGGKINYPDFGMFTERKSLSPFMDGWQPKNWGNPLERERLKVYEIWTNPDTDFDMEYDEEKFVSGNHGSVFVLCGDQVLSARENTHRINGKIFIPIVTFVNYGRSTDPYGFGDIKSVAGNQITINMMLSQMVMCLILTANPQLIYEEGAVNRQFLTNKPGLAIEMAKGMYGRLMRLEGSQPPAGLFQVIADQIRSAEEISSVNDLMRGAMPQTHTPAAAVAQQQNIGFNRIRKQAKRLNMAYREDARIELWMLQNFWDFQPRLGPGELEFAGEWQDMDDRFREMAFDVTVAGKADLPTTMSDKISWASQVMQVGGMDAEEFVNFTEIPVSDRFKEKLRLTSDIQLMQAELVREQLRTQLEQVRAQRTMVQGGTTSPNAGIPPQQGASPEMGNIGAGMMPAPQAPMALGNLQ